MVTVLVIDHDPKRLSLVSSRLEGVLGLTVSKARQDLLTVRLFRKTRPGLVLLGLDELDSWMLTALVRADATVPVVGYSAGTDNDGVRKAVLSGARNLLSTNASREQFLSAILEALRPEDSMADGALVQIASLEVRAAA